MTVENGVLTGLSVSEVTSFDETQVGGCPRRWWFERPMMLKPEQNNAQTDGDKGHALFATYFTTGQLPQGRVKMGKAVTGAIVKGDLPKPGHDLLVEERFSGQSKFDAAGQWIPLDVSETLWLGGVPWEGFIDLAYRRDDVPVILDHKFSSDIHTHAKKPGELIKTVQLPVYVLSQVPYWPDAKRWKIAHHYIARTGVDSFIRSAVVHLDQVLERKAQIESVVERMKTFATATDQNDVPANASGSRRACEAWNGCPHQSICSAYKEKNKVELTPEEAALFEDLDNELPTPPPPPAPVKERKMKYVDTPPAIPAGTPEDPALPPPPAPAPAKAEPQPVCACSAVLTPENASKLQSGAWKHIGCPLDAPAAPAPAPKERKAKAPAAPPPAPAAPAAVAPNPAGAIMTLRAGSVADLLESIARLLRAA